MVGNVNGQRLWAHNIPDAHRVCWSPNGKRLLVGLRGIRVTLYDEAGSFLAPVRIQVFDEEADANTQVADIKWFYRKSVHAGQPTLAVCYRNGRVQVMLDERDEDPVMFDSRIEISACEWNPYGDVLSIAGKAVRGRAQGGQVLLYSPQGQLLFALYCGQSEAHSCDFDKTGLRMAIAADQHCIIANVRPYFKYGFFNSVLVYATESDAGVQDAGLVFLDAANETVNTTRMPSRIICLAAYGDFCVVAYKSPNEDNHHTLSIINSQAVPVDSTYTFIEPEHIVLTNADVIVSSKNAFFVWHYRSSGLSGLDSAHVRKEAKERYIHIDDTGATGTLKAVSGDKTALYSRVQEPTDDPIKCMCGSNEALLIGRRSGAVHHYSLPSVSLDKVIPQTIANPRHLALNSDATRLAVISEAGEFFLAALEAVTMPKDYGEKRSFQAGEKIPLLEERNYVWGAMWADDDPEMFLLLERQRMYVFRGVTPEEPLPMPGYLCCFSGLVVKSANLTLTLTSPAAKRSPPMTIVESIEVKSLRDTRMLLEKVGVSDALAFIEDHQHQVRN